MKRFDDLLIKAAARVVVPAALAVLFAQSICVGDQNGSPTLTVRIMAPPPSTGNNAQAPAAGVNSKTPAVAVSTSTLRAEPTVSDLYPVEKLRLRDPFTEGGASSAGYSGGGEVVEFSIHNLVLKGIMQDPTGDFALFIDSASGKDYVLKKNQLYNNKNKPVPGVSGIIKPQQKTVHLLTSDQDVQTFVLGEERGAE